MKKNNNAIDPEREELEKLREALDQYKALQSEADKFVAFQTAVNSEVESFATNGDLLDLKAVSAIAAKQLQSTLVERRIASLGAKLEQSDAKLTAVTATVGRLLLGDLNQIKNGVIEQVAKSMQQHFDDYQASRRTAAQSNGAREIALRIVALESAPNNTEAPLLAEHYLELAPQLSDELKKIRDSLGGGIPSASELAAN